MKVRTERGRYKVGKKGTLNEQFIMKKIKKNKRKQKQKRQDNGKKDREKKKKELEHC